MSDYVSQRQARAGIAAGASDSAQPLRTAVGSDHLAYVADLIAELQELARQGQFETLATILGLAELEASRLAAERRLAPPR